MNDLSENERAGFQESLGEQAFVLRGFALPYVNDLLIEIAEIEKVSPFRHMITPGGLKMSVGLANCGTLGWISDSRGYRYTEIDPVTGNSWPQMPEAFRSLARSAASGAGFENFVPDACLVNQYQPGNKLHFIRIKTNWICTHQLFRYP